MTRVKWLWNERNTESGDIEIHTYPDWELVATVPKGHFENASRICNAHNLLADNKRLRTWIEQAIDVWENSNHEDRTEWFNNFCEVMSE
jgi:hypothetical protein